MREPKKLGIGNLLALTAALGSLACGSDDAPQSPNDQPGARYALASLVSSGDESNMYVSFVDELEGQKVDHELGREFSGSADLWLFEGALFVADGEELTVTKFDLNGRALDEGERISFTDYGIAGFGFWSNTFVDAHKAYYLNGTTELVVWDPTDMAITSTVSLPDLESDGLHLPVAAYGDRASPVRDGLLYQPVYYADESYFDFGATSTILVIDTAKDELVETLEAPCPGLDYSTQAPNGDLYSSSWVYAPAGAAVLDGPKTCVVRIPADDPTHVEVAFDVADVTDGREGGVFRYVDGERALLSVLHDDRAAEEGVTELQAVGFGPYWRFWSLDGEQRGAEIEAIDWNAGAAYPAYTRGAHILVPAGDYTSTIVYDLSQETPAPVLESQGWVLRLFEL